MKATPTCGPRDRELACAALPSLRYFTHWQAGCTECTRYVLTPGEADTPAVMQVSAGEETARFELVRFALAVAQAATTPRAEVANGVVTPLGLIA